MEYVEIGYFTHEYRQRFHIESSPLTMTYIQICNDDEIQTILNRCQGLI